MKYRPHNQQLVSPIQKYKKQIYLVCSGILLSGFLIGWIITFLIYGNHPHPKEGLEDCTSELSFIRQNINCEYSDRKKIELENLDSELEILSSKYVKSGDVTRIGVFVRDLRSTHFSGINEGESFYGASLLKLPLIIASYKQAEIQPEILKKEIKYDGNIQLTDNQSIEVKDKLKVGSTYTVKDLIDRSVIYSDNTSAQILYESLPIGYFDLILTAIGIQYKLSDGSEEILVTPRTYANLFRLLYNTSYLTAEYSNQILETLTKVDYKEGAMKKLPRSLVVAHKFAERTIEDPITKKVKLRQLHECGLVYLNNNKDTYTFCIMSEGKDFKKLEKVQQEISLIIYNKMSDKN